MDVLCSIAARFTPPTGPSLGFSSGATKLTAATPLKHLALLWTTGLGATLRRAWVAPALVGLFGCSPKVQSDATLPEAASGVANPPELPKLKVLSDPQSWSIWYHDTQKVDCAKAQALTDIWLLDTNLSVDLTETATGHWQQVTSFSYQVSAKRWESIAAVYKYTADYSHSLLVDGDINIANTQYRQAKKSIQALDAQVAELEKKAQEQELLAEKANLVAAAFHASAESIAAQKDAAWGVCIDESSRSDIVGNYGVPSLVGGSGLFAVGGLGLGVLAFLHLRYNRKRADFIEKLQKWAAGEDVDEDIIGALKKWSDPNPNSNRLSEEFVEDYYRLYFKKRALNKQVFDALDQALRRADRADGAVDLVVHLYYSHPNQIIPYWMKCIRDESLYSYTKMKLLDNLQSRSVNEWIPKRFQNEVADFIREMNGIKK